MLREHLTRWTLVLLGLVYYQISAFFALALLCIYFGVSFRSMSSLAPQTALYYLFSWGTGGGLGIALVAPKHMLRVWPLVLACVGLHTALSQYLLWSALNERIFFVPRIAAIYLIHGTATILGWSLYLFTLKFVLKSNELSLKQQTS